MVFGFEHMEIDQIIVKWFHTRFHWDKFMQVLDRWQKEVGWNTLYLENHDQPRSVSRFGSSKYPEASAKLLATLLLTLKGTPFIFEGQEIGMRNFDYENMDEIRDVESRNVYGILSKVHVPAKLKWYMIRNVSRDNARTPMQWSDEEQAGFMPAVDDKEPWLKVNSNYKTINVKAQREDPDSILSGYKELIRLRKESEDLLSGAYTFLSGNSRYSLYQRGDLTILLNHSDEKLLLRSLQKYLPDLKRGKESILFSTDKENMDLSGEQAALQPWQAVIIK